MKTKERDCVIGVDVGGTKIASGLVDQEGKLILRIEVETPFNDGNLTTEALKKLLGECMRAAEERGLQVEGVGIGVAGYVIAETGFLISSPNINWSEVPLRQIVMEFTNLRTVVDNDAAVAAIGEHFAGAARGIRNFVLFTVGTGVGGGVFIDGKLYRGSRGTAAEVGHMVVEPSGPLCGCGNRGCLESLASGTALRREAIKRVEGTKGSKNSKLLDLCGGDTSKITGEMVTEAAREGDEIALSCLDYIGFYLGIGVINMVHLFDPELVVLGGGVMEAGDLLLPRVRTVVEERGVEPLVEGVEVVASTLGSDIGVIGAGAAAWEVVQAHS